MSEDQILETIFKIAGEIKGSPLTPQERIAIRYKYKTLSGSEYEKANKVISESLGIAESTVIRKRAAIDDTNRLSQDIINALRDKQK
jgi:FixJ family two-component response regulator